MLLGGGWLGVVGPFNSGRTPGWGGALVEARSARL